MPPDRIRSLDTWRGLMLVIMAVDHLDLYGPIYRLTYETFGFLSAAEGFVLVSGLVAGLVYGGYAETPGRLRPMVRRRLGTLYRYHLLIVAGLLGYWWAFPPLRPDGGMPSAALHALGGVALLNQEPPLDILALYILFVALLPLVLGGFRRGRAPAVLAASASLWVLDEILTPLAGYPIDIRFTVNSMPVHWQPNNFHLLAWQFLFVVAVWLVWRRRSGPLMPPGTSRRWLAAAAGLVVLACFTLRHGLGVDEVSRAGLAAARVNLGWLRTGNLAAVVILVNVVNHRWPRVFHCPWLELLGRQALLVFTWQTMLQMFLRPFYLQAADRWGIGARLALILVVVASLGVVARARERWRRQRSSERLTGPAVDT